MCNKYIYIKISNVVFTFSLGDANSVDLATKEARGKEKINYKARLEHKQYLVRRCLLNLFLHKILDGR